MELCRVDPMRVDQNEFSPTRALTKSFGTDQYIIFHQNYIISATIIDIKQKEKSSVQSLLDRCDVIISVIFYLTQHSIPTHQNQT